MNDVVLSVLVLFVWIATWPLGYKIMKWKNRMTALLATVFFPFLGLIVALLLDQKCRYCRSYISMAATVCPKCGRTIKTGKVDIDVKAVAGVPVKQPEVPKPAQGKIVYDPETHQYVKI